MVGDFKQIARDASGREFPEEPLDQLRLAIEAVFASWNNKRAIDYRNVNKIAHELGTAVNVQTMVFGNLGETSATGVAFTRNPSTGEKTLYGDYLVNAQGEDVVAGIRNTSPISHLKDEMPGVYDQFQQIATRLEGHYRDVQDLEFTIEQGRLYMLQTRAAKRTAAAAVSAAVEMVREKVITEKEALGRVKPSRSCSCCYHASTTRTSPARKRPDANWRGVNASPGAAVGKAIFDADRAEEAAKSGEQVILVRRETSPDDYHGMIVAQGILTSQGGTGSHAAVVARGAGLPAVVGCDALRVDYDARQFTLKDGQTVREGDVLSIDGTTGLVYLGAIETVEPNFARGDRAADAAGLGGQVPQARRLGQRRLSPRRRARGDVWRAGYRPLPHRAHVHGAGAPAHRAGDDPRADEEGAGSRAR